MSGSIGAVLKDARTKRSITLEDVHSKLKIHPRVLQLLEEDKFDKLPSPLFVKSFLKSYAEFLEVSSEELLSTYEREKKKDPEQVLYIRPADPAMGHPKMHPLTVAAGIGAALLFLFVLMGEPAKLLKSFTSKVRSPGAASERVKKAALEKERAAVTREAPTAVREEVGASEWLNSPALGNFPKINRKTALTLDIRAIDSVWVHVTSDGTVVYQGVMKKGDAGQWTSKNSIQLWTGNASNMYLTLNKTPLGSPGKGVVKKMIISHEGVRIASAT